MHAKSIQSCPTLCNPMDSNWPGSSVHGILQARTLEWVAVSFSNAWKWKVKVKLLSHVQLFATPWNAALEASLSITSSQTLLKLTSIELVMPSNHLILCRPFFSCLPSFPTSGFFPISQFFMSGGQNIGASASVFPININDWFPLRLNGLISFQSKGLSRVISSTIVQKHQFLGAQLSLWSNFHIHTWLLEKL